MTHKKTSNKARFCFYDPSLKLFFSKDILTGVKSFQQATIWLESDSTGPILLSHIVDWGESDQTLADLLRAKYSIPQSFRKISVETQYLIKGL